MTTNNGAPRGNKNAQKHGIYSVYIAVIDSEEQIEKMSHDNNKAELAYARSRLVNAQIKYNTAAENILTKASDLLQLDFACRHWTEIIDNMLARNTKKGETEQMIFTSLIEAIRAANDNQKVVR